MPSGRIRCIQWLVVAAVPLAIMADSAGPPIRRAGAPVDDQGATCFQCHNGGPGVNQGSGRVTIGVGTYVPGLKQDVSITITDPTALRWGFEMTARLVSDPAKQAGTFIPSDQIQVRCAPDGRSDVSCNGEPEFAMHRASSTFPSSGGPKTYLLSWVPPSDDAGPVTFYVAVTAANNDNLATGDRVYTASSTIGTSGCNLPESGKPALASGVNAALNSAGGQARIAPNTLISIYGSSLFRPSATFQTRAQNLVNGKLPNSAACVTVEIGGQPAPILYISDSQINVQAPILTGGGGQDQVKVTLNKGTPNEIVVLGAANYGPYSPAFFTFLNSKSIAGLTQRYELLAAPSVVAGGVPAKPGEIVVLYGTGFGFTIPAYRTGEFASGIAPLVDPITVTIGGTTLTASDIFYAGLASDAPGFYQFNLRVPASAPDGDVPVKIAIGGVETQPGTTIPIKR